MVLRSESLRYAKTLAEMMALYSTDLESSSWVVHNFGHEPLTSGFMATTILLTGGVGGASRSPGARIFPGACRERRPEDGCNRPGSSPDFLRPCIQNHNRIQTSRPPDHQTSITFPGLEFASCHINGHTIHYNIPTTPGSSLHESVCCCPLIVSTGTHDGMPTHTCRPLMVNFIVPFSTKSCGSDEVEGTASSHIPVDTADPSCPSARSNGGWSLSHESRFRMASNFLSLIASTTEKLRHVVRKSA